MTKLAFATKGLALPLTQVADLLGFGLVLDRLPLPRGLGGGGG